MKKFVLLLAAFAFSNGFAEFIHLVPEPRKIYQVSSKTERAWTLCRYCQCKVRYDRTWKRNHDDGSWVETTACVPRYCRHCEKKVRELDKYRAREARLDLKLEKLAIKERIQAKRS